MALIQQRIADFIEESGHSATVVPADESDTRFFVRFQSHGDRYQVNVDASDPCFLYISAAYAFAHPPAFDGHFWRTLLDAQQKVKAVKFDLEGDVLVAGVEQFWAEPDGFKTTFWRCVKAVRHGSAECMRRVAERTPAPPALPAPLSAHDAAERFIAAFPLYRPSGDANNLADAPPPARRRRNKRPTA